MTTNMPDAASARPTGRIILAACVLPILIAATSALLVWSWRDDLPARPAIHWGLDGTADGFASVSTSVILILGFGLGLAAAGLAFALAKHNDTMLARVAAGTSAGTTGFIAGIVALALADQRGLADAADASTGFSTIAGSLAIGAAAAIVAVALIPRWTTTSPTPPADAPRLQLGESETATWTRSVASGNHVVGLLVIIVGITAVTTVVSRQWWILIVTAAIIALLALMYSIRVTVDHRGLTITGALGWPRFHTPIDEISHATVVQVHPLRQFGGYGFRIAAFGPFKGAHGFIMRGGEGVLLERISGRRTVVVVDNATTAAGLINTLVERTRRT